MGIAFINISNFNSWLFLSRRFTRLPRVYPKRFISSVTFEIHSLPGEKCLVHLNKFALGKINIFSLTEKEAFFAGRTEQTSEVFCVECSVVWCRDLDTTTEWAKTTRSIWDVGMEKNGACKMDRQNKKSSCARKSGRRKNTVGTDEEEEKKLTGPLAKKELPAEGCSKTGAFNSRAAGRLRPSGEFCAAR